jgi:hypothetical protein
MGISCKGILDPLSDYLEGDAGRDVCKMIEEHLDSCEKCRMHVDNMKRVITLYKRWRGDAIPEDVSIRLRNRLADEAGRRAGEKKAGPRKGGKKTSRPTGGKTSGKKTRRGPGGSKTKGTGKPKPRS